MKRTRVLIADDEPLILSSLCGFLKDQAWDILTASDGRQALQMLLEHHPDVAVLDLRMPELSGFEVLKRAIKRGISTDIAILTAFGTVQEAVETVQTGARDFMVKPISKEMFIKKIHEILASRSAAPNALGERLMAFVVAQCANPDFHLTHLREKFHISKSYACRQFRLMGTSFTDALAKARIDRARHLMDTTGDPLYVIAEVCGFKNAQRLCEVFSRLEGCAPSQYRKLGRPERIK